MQSLTLTNLPDAIQLSAGRLTIQFEGVEQLFTRLYQLSQAATNDFDRFRLAAGAAATRALKSPGSPVRQQCREFPGQ